MKIIQNNPYLGDIIDTVLENRGIWNRELFLNPDDSTNSDPSKVRNINEGKELLFKHLGSGNSIDIVIDQDADGYTSAATLYSFLSNFGHFSKIAKIGFINHETKAHGLTEYIMKQIIERDPELVIIPDAGSNDTKQIEELVDMGIDVLVIDHHHVTEFTNSGVIVNNQLCENTNPRLVGVGMVYKFIKLIDDEYGLDIADDYLDLVAVGQIGDASDIADNEIRNLVHRGLDNIQNGFLQAAIGEVPMGKKIAPKDLSFGVIPIINAVTRVGELEERDILFKALANIDTDKTFPTVKKKKNKSTGKFENIDFQYNIYEHAYDVAQKCKTRQDSAVKKMVESLDKTLVDDAGVIIAFTGNIANPGITGLIANKLMSKYDKPVLLLNEQENSYTGSGRGHEKTITDFRAWCDNSNLVIFAQGHDNAFGIGISKDKFDQFKEYSRKIEKKEPVYEVDYITNKLEKDMAEKIDDNLRLFGGKVSEPFIGVLGISIPKKFVNLKGSMLNMFSWGVSVVQFGTKIETYEKIMSCPDDNVKINMVGYYSMNCWNDVKRPQFIIKDIEVVEQNNNAEVDEDSIIF